MKMHTRLRFDYANKYMRRKFLYFNYNHMVGPENSLRQWWVTAGFIRWKEWIPQVGTVRLYALDV